jgi:hypothetical protein
LTGLLTFCLLGRGWFEIAELRAWDGIIAGLRLLACWRSESAIVLLRVMRGRWLEYAGVGLWVPECGSQIGVGVGLCLGVVGLQLRRWSGVVAVAKLWACRWSTVSDVGQALC